MADVTNKQFDLEDWVLAADEHLNEDWELPAEQGEELVSLAKALLHKCAEYGVPLNLTMVAAKDNNGFQCRTMSHLVPLERVPFESLVVDMIQRLGYAGFKRHEAYMENVVSKGEVVDPIHRLLLDVLGDQPK